MEIIIAAVTLGVTAGLKPGPLSIYVIHQTLLHGARSGFLASLAPFASDGPIILGSFLLVNSFKHFDLFITMISVLGALYIAYIAVKLLVSTPALQQPAKAPSSFMTAVKINLLNPAPYLFWSTVGGTYLVQNDLAVAVVFAVVFLGTLAMTKFVMAISIKKLGDHSGDRLISHLLKFLAVILFLFAIRLLLNGLALA